MTIGRGDVKDSEVIPLRNVKYKNRTIDEIREKGSLDTSRCSYVFSDAEWPENVIKMLEIYSYEHFKVEYDRWYDRLLPARRRMYKVYISLDVVP